MSANASAARLFVLLGAASAFVAIMAGAFGSHGLKARLSPDMLTVFEIAVRYQIYHALGLLFLACWCRFDGANPLLERAGWLFSGGTLLFSGSLYVLSLTGMRILGAITPIGGLLFLIGWAHIFWAALRSAR
jgi:uncharacterized membrane protein YgdD (TMEM256/DUF423 family)